MTNILGHLCCASLIFFYFFNLGDAYPLAEYYVGGKHMVTLKPYIVSYESTQTLACPTPTFFQVVDCYLIVEIDLVALKSII